MNTWFSHTTWFVFIPLHGDSSHMGHILSNWCYLLSLSPGPNNTLVTTVYRKPTHTDQYLYLDSNHFITAKRVFNTLAFRAKVVCTRQHSLHKEMEHIRKALQACNFPLWAINILQNKFNCKHSIYNGHATNSTTHQQQQQWINKINLYSGTLHFKRTWNNLGIQVHFRGTNTSKTLLMDSKDRNN